MPRKHAIRRVAALAFETPWAITAEKLEQIVDLLERRGQGHLEEAEIEARLNGLRRQVILEEEEDPYLRIGGVALVRLYGVITPRANLMTEYSGGTSAQEFCRAISQAGEDPEIAAIVIDVDSPGGSVLGVAEAAEVVAAVNGRKPVLALAHGQCCSAAYWIASAAGRLLATPSSLVGSIGVYTVHSDYSAADTTAGIRRTVIHAGTRKAVENPHETLRQNDLDVVRQRVNDYYAMFVDAVATYRGIPPARVESDFGQGIPLVASRALSAGLIDGIASLDSVLNELAGATTGGGGPVAQVPGTTETTPQESNPMDKEVIAQLVALGLLAASAGEAEAKAALATFYGGAEKIPADPHAILADLRSARKTQAKETPQAATVATTAVPAVVPDPTAEARGQAAERERILQIQARGELLGVEPATIRGAIERGTSLHQFLLEATESRAQRETAVVGHRPQPTASANDKFARAAVDALFVRAGFALEQPAAGTADLRYASMMELARESLRLRNGRLVGAIPPEQVARAALGDPEALGLLAADVPYSTPSDFPNLLSGLANKVLLAAPQYVGTTFQSWAVEIPALPDFKPATLLSTGEFGEFPEKTDSDDFEGSQFLEETNWIQVGMFGDEFALTPRMIQDDNLGAFTQALLGKRVAYDATLNRMCVNVLVGNPTLLDGGALFNTTAQTTAGGHANLAGSGAVPSTTTLGAARQAFRKMLGPSLKRKLNYTLALILVPEELETTVEQLLRRDLMLYPQADAPITNVTSGPNPFRGRVDYQIDPMIGEASAAAWFAFVTPAVARAIIYAKMQGYENLVVRTYYNPKNNCRIWQFEGRAAAAAANYRGVYKNPGS